MGIVEQVIDVLNNAEFAHVRQQAEPMQALYREMERQGYTEKQGYTIAPVDGLLKSSEDRSFSSYHTRRC